MIPSRALAYVNAYRRQSLAQLQDFIRFPTVSAQPKHANDMVRCARWLANHLRKIGMPRVQIFGSTHPIVFAASRRIPAHPTVLIYGHYDVQPPDPLKEWQSHPFEPVVKNGYVFGRGACDDKGQMFAHVKALEAYLRTPASLPVNAKCIFEGEEEIGSPSLRSFLERNRRPLAAHVAVMSDMPIPSPQQPAITYALRGGLSLEMEVSGPQRDLHSGLYGGAVHNPLQALCEIVGSLHDEDGRVTIPGFYDQVRRWSEQERDFMQRAGPSDAQVLKDASAERPWGESDFTLYERTTIRPALTVNGIVGGYQGPGGKGVIPAQALAKLSFRLVPDQDPQEIEQLCRRYIADVCPSSVKVKVRRLSMAKPALVNRNHPALQAAKSAYRKGFGAEPVFLRCGGTIPVVNLLQEVLGIPTVLMGFALPDDHIHAPNERFRLANFFNGIQTSIWFLAAVAAACKSGRPNSVSTHQPDGERGES